MKSYAHRDSQEVVTVAGTLRNGSRANILNSDGQPHPVQNILTVVTLLLGLVSFVLPRLDGLGREVAVVELLHVLWRRH